MGVIRVNYREIEEIRFGYCLGSGKEGRCYFYEEDNCIVKLYHCMLRHGQLYFDDLYDSKIAFPRDILFYENTDLIAGYTMPYLRGKSLNNGFFSDMSFDELKLAYLELKKLIEKYKNIYMDDLCLDNIFYDKAKKSFSLIDTSRWYPKKDGYKENINDINWVFIACLILNLDIKNNIIFEDRTVIELYSMYYHYGLQSIRKYHNFTFDRIDISELFLQFLKVVVEKTSENEGKNIKTIKELIRKKENL